MQQIKMLVFKSKKKNWAQSVRIMMVTIGQKQRDKNIVKFRT